MSRHLICNRRTFVVVAAVGKWESILIYMYVCRSIDLKDKVKIVRTLDWFARGAQRHRALRENPRAKELERASCFFEYLVYGAIPLDGQLVSR